MIYTTLSKLSCLELCRLSHIFVPHVIPKNIWRYPSWCDKQRTLVSYFSRKLHVRKKSLMNKDLTASLFRTNQSQDRTINKCNSQKLLKVYRIEVMEGWARYWLWKDRKCIKGKKHDKTYWWLYLSSKKKNWESK